MSKLAEQPSPKVLKLKNSLSHLTNLSLSFTGITICRPGSRLQKST